MRRRCGRRRSAVVVVVAMAALATACVAGSDAVVQTLPDDTASDEAAAAAAEPVTTTSTAPTTTSTTAPTTTTAPPDPVGDLIATWSVEQKAGQLLVPILAGTSAGAPSAAEAEANRSITGVDSMAAAVAELGLGGVLYLGANVVDADQLTTLSADLQAAAEAAGLPGLVIAVDQEGGRVNRISDGVEVFPSARSLAPDADAVEAAAFATGDGVARQGVNVVLAPVADLTSGSAGVIGNRSFSDDPAVAAEMVSASVRGLQAAGVAAVVKHWPGHGATALDSHEVLPVIDVDEPTWRARERVPFAAAVTEGVAGVMIGHLAFPSLDGTGEPATTSGPIVDGLLRDDLGFGGAVWSDALDMGAVRDQDRAELAVRAIDAGVDILLAPPDAVAARDGIVDAVADGRLDEDRLDAAVRRVVELKVSLGLLELAAD